MISWNRIEDEKDLEVWDRLIGNSWLLERIPPLDDVPSWSTLKPHEQQMAARVFIGLTLLDTTQGTVEAVSLIPGAVTPHEEAVLTSTASVESAHAKSYSSIFSTLISIGEIDETFRWSEENEYPRKKARIILDYYRDENVKKHKMVSTMLESSLFYSGFYALTYWFAHTKLANTAGLIRLIIRDEAVHGHYIGYKYQKALAKAPQERHDELQEYVYSLAMDLYDNEELYTEPLYDETGLAKDVKMSLRHNANKASNSLRYEALFGSDQTAISPSIFAALSSNVDENHDPSFGSGPSYVIGTAEVMTDDDWDF